MMLFFLFIAVACSKVIKKCISDTILAPFQVSCGWRIHAYLHPSVLLITF